MRSGAYISLLISLIAVAAEAGTTWTLTESAVIERALSTHLGIAAAREDAGMAAADLTSARGAFDTTVGGQVDHRIDKSASMAPQIFGTRTDTTRYELDASKRWPTGTETALSFGNTKRRVDGSAFINPTEYESLLSLDVTQPLLKNGAGIADRRNVSAAREAFKAADAAVQRRVQEAVRASLDWYWRIVFSQREVAVAQRAITAAQAFLAITEERYRLGTADGTDLLAAKANVASREANLLATKTVLEAATHGLKMELQLPLADPVAARDALPAVRGAQPSLDGAVALALANRPDFRAAQHQAEALQLKLQMAQNRKYPSLDLVGSLAINELSTISHGDAVGGMNNPNVLVGLRFSVPIENRAARGVRDRARHERAKALIDLKALENRIVHEIEERLATLPLLAGQVRSQERAELLQEERVALEQDQYGLGRSSSLEVIRAQDDHLAARLAAIRARSDAQRAWLDYRLATGQLP
ncbi:MAG: TolC family protein [Deltaproteobacteria bacterium]|nr:TolC family protein [Deltaproteobacteria bacterium]